MTALTINPLPTALDRSPMAWWLADKGMLLCRSERTENAYPIRDGWCGCPARVKCRHLIELEELGGETYVRAMLQDPEPYGPEGNTRMQQSTTLKALAFALCKAQAEVEDAAKSRTNPAFRSQYSTLGNIWDACKPALTKHGLSVTQIAEPAETGHLALTTMLLHESGEWLAGTMVIPLAKLDPQSYGSALTYARRYGLAAIVGVCPDDDDAQAAQPARTTAPATQGRGGAENGSAQPDGCTCGATLHGKSLHMRPCPLAVPVAA